MSCFLLYRIVILQKFKLHIHIKVTKVKILNNQIYIVTSNNNLKLLYLCDRHYTVTFKENLTLLCPSI